MHKEDAAFAAGFASVRGNDDGIADRDGEQDEKQAADIGDAGVQDQPAPAVIFDGMTAEQIKQAVTDAQEARALREQLATMKAQAGGGGDKGPGDQAPAADADDEPDPFEKEYPDLAEATKRIAERLLKQRGMDPEQIRKLTDQNADLFRQTQELHLAATYGHSDWRDVIGSEDYKTWLAAQPEDVRTTAETTPNAADLAKVLTAFKAANTKPKDAPGEGASKRRLEAAETPRGTTPGAPRTPSADDEFRAGFRAVRGG